MAWMICLEDVSWKENMYPGQINFFKNMGKCLLRPWESVKSTKKENKA